MVQFKIRPGRGRPDSSASVKYNVPGSIIADRTQTWGKYWSIAIFEKTMLHLTITVTLTDSVSAFITSWVGLGSGKPTGSVRWSVIFLKSRYTIVFTHVYVRPATIWKGMSYFRLAARAGLQLYQVKLVNR